MSREYDPDLVRVLDALDLEAHGWIVRDDSYADISGIRIGSQATPDRLVRMEVNEDDPEHCYYGLQVYVGPEQADYFGGEYELVETGYNATVDEVLEAMERHLDPDHEPDTRVKKDRRIRALVARLDLDRRGWIVADEWEHDLCAIGIGVKENPRHLVYVAMYQDKLDRYFYSCETPTGPDPTDYKVVDEAEPVSFDTLLAAMERHLGSR